MTRKLVLILLAGFSVHIAASEFAVKGECIKQDTESVKSEIDKAFWASMKDDVTLEESGLKRFASVIIADPSLVDTGHLGAAASENKIDVMRFLLDYGVDVNGQDKRRGTALHRAAHKGNTELLQFLLDHHADCEVKDRYGQTPFFNALEELHLESLSLFLRHKINVHGKDKCGETALHKAFLNRTPYRFYISKDTLGDGMKERRQAIDMLLNVGLSIHTEKGDGRTILVDAIYSRNLKMMNLAVEKGADVNHIDSDGSTPLLHAYLNFWREDMSGIDFLMTHGAHPKVMDSRGNTVFHILAHLRHKNLVLKTIEIGQDAFNTLNNAGKTPLDIALMQTGDCYKYDWVASRDAVTQQIIIDSLKNIGAKTSSELLGEK